jgi:hypothetical protein
LEPDGAVVNGLGARCEGAQVGEVARIGELQGLG